MILEISSPWIADYTPKDTEKQKTVKANQMPTHNDIIDAIVDRDDAEELKKFIFKNLPSAHSSPAHTITTAEKKNQVNLLSSILTVVCMKGAERCLATVLEKLGQGQFRGTQIEGKFSDPFMTVGSYDMHNLLPLLFKHQTTINSFNTGDHRTETPLQYAAGTGGLKVIQSLLDTFHCSINEQNDSGETALHFAAANGQRDAVILLLKYGANVDLRDGEGANALFHAIEGKSDECLSALLEFHPDLYLDVQLDSITSQGYTPLHGAVMSNSVKCARVLLEKDEGRFRGEKNRIVKCPTLLNMTRLGETPLMLSSRGSAEMFQYLLSKFEESKLINLEKTLNLRNRVTNRRCIDMACKNGNEKIVEILLKHGCDVGQINYLSTRNDGSPPVESSHTPLYFAATRGKTKCMELVLRKGKANINELNRIRLEGRVELAGIEKLDACKLGFSALLGAVAHRQDSAVKKLLRRGAIISRAERIFILDRLRDDDKIRQMIVKIHCGYNKKKGCDQVYCQNGRKVLDFLGSVKHTEFGVNKGKIRVKNRLSKLPDDVIGEILEYCDRNWFIMNEKK